MDEHTVTLTYREYAMFLDKLTVRDQFAMAALPALLARHRADVAWSEVAPLSYKIADAMLEARKEKK